ncbi:mitochondrial ribonuclease P protein 1-like protein [Euroglyphus maynei]|uniref:RNA (guanine-9-)-methyltransferase domain-containing protein 1 n=1 Tax=Euroglyphus maynei TaxID=6958 RepID=A0A1Y3ARL9_EURMA|nr:mitochondrial ribonuclease P protein 1-like protein [Euroglyphus maynei]
MLFNKLFRFTVNKNKIFKLSIRHVNLIVPDIEDECLLRRAETRENFDQIYPQLKLPFKLRHQPEYSREFIRERLDHYPRGFQPIDLEKYSELWLREQDFDRQQTIRKDVEMIIIYYNDVLRYSLFSPSTIPFDDMEKMLQHYDGHGARLRYVNFIFVREYDSWRREKEAEEKSRLKRLAEQEDYFEDIGCFDMNTNQLQYGYWRNSLFTKFFEHARHRQTIGPLRTAQIYGQPLIIDCGLERLMAHYEILSCVRQISKIYHLNRYSMNPFKLLFTEFDRNHNRTYEPLRKNMHQFIDQPEFCFNLHSESYQQLLPDERFIYLSPDAQKLMNEFDPNAVYIIGALVSKTQKSTLTWDRAREQGIECLRLPIHQHVRLKPMVKRILSFCSTFQILLLLKHGATWEQAFRQSIQSHKLMD